MYSCVATTAKNKVHCIHTCCTDISPRARILNTTP